MVSLIVKRIKQLTSVLRGFLFKWRYDIIGFSRLPNLAPRQSSPQFIVSLTSYGRRVANVLPYTLVSLLKQSVLPDRIVLWLDEEKWSNETLPKKIHLLKRHGIEIRFCKDIRSYTKLIPALQEFPNDVIITVDDDGVYRKDLLEELLLAYQDDPTRIYSHHVRYPTLDSEGRFTPYNCWESETYENKFIMPLGVSGVLYPPRSLHPDVTDSQTALTLCPMADDLWFWIMALRKGTRHKAVFPEKSLGCNFDDLYQFIHKGTNLTYLNRKKGANDRQLANICSHYKLDLS